MDSLVLHFVSSCFPVLSLILDSLPHSLAGWHGVVVVQPIPTSSLEVPAGESL